MLKKYKSINKNFSFLDKTLVLVGLILILVPLAWHISKISLSFNTHYSFDKSSAGVYRESNLQSIGIPKINTYLQIDEGKVDDGQWDVSDDGVMHYIYSSSPGERGNIVIYGHNKKTILGNLDKLTNGDLISLYTNDNNVYKYMIKSIEIVDPDRVDVISPTLIEVLTVYTCTGLFDSKRLVIKAYPV